jgi:hypothetical protein
VAQKKSKKTKKKDELHLREAMNEPECSECEHFFPNAFRCTVLGTGVSKAFEIQEDHTCDAWNDKDYENTWFLAGIAHQKKVYFEVNEIRANPDNLTETDNQMIEVGKFEIEMPVPSIPQAVFSQMKEYFKKTGCPDFLVNLNPRTMLGERLADLLRNWGIKYTELSWENFDFGIAFPDDMEPKEKLSAMVDAYLTHQEE